MKTEISNDSFELELDPQTAAKFAVLLNDESMMHAGFVAHQSNSDTIGLDETTNTNR